MPGRVPSGIDWARVNMVLATGMKGWIDTSASWLPAFVVGYAHDDETMHPPSSQLPNWMVSVEHQCACHGCAHVRLTGAVVSLNANNGYLLTGTWLLARAMHDMAAHCEDGYNAEQVQDLAEKLSNLVRHGSSGDVVDKSQLSELLRKHLGLGPELEVKWGHEGIIAFHEWDYLPYLGGWRIAIPGSTDDATTDDATFDFENQPYSVSEVFQTEHSDALISLGKTLGRVGAPRVYLLWENCD